MTGVVARSGDWATTPAGTVGNRQGSRHFGNFTAGTCGQCREDRIDRVTEEVRRAIGEHEVGTAGVQAPEVKQVALLVHAAGLEMVGAGRAGRDVAAAHVPFPYAKQQIGRAGAPLAEAGVPPSIPEIGASTTTRQPR